VDLAEGGVRCGQVISVSDRLGTQPMDGRIQPPELLATLFRCLGIRPDAEVRDALGRPVPITRGEVLRQVF
jgi:hypothetical protein